MNKKSSVPVGLALALMVGVMSFKDTGIFVKSFVSNEQKVELSFKEGEKVDIVKETDLAYLVNKDGKNIEVPKSKMIRDTKSDSTYKVKTDTLIKKSDNGTPLRTLKKDEIIEVVSLDESNGIFKTKDNLVGYVDIKNLEKIVKETTTMGTSKSNISLSNGKSSYKLTKGAPVKIKDFKDGKYLIIGMDDQEYEVAQSHIQANKVSTATRGKTNTNNIENKSKADKIVAAAHKELGKPYVSGDTGKRGYDCSGLTYSVYLKTLNIKLPRTSGAQAKAGKSVKKSELQPGDLVFFRTSGRNIGHVGIYIGNGNMIHASTGRRSMIVASINSSYFKSRYVTARRIIN